MWGAKSVWGKNSIFPKFVENMVASFIRIPAFAVHAKLTLNSRPSGWRHQRLTFTFQKRILRMFIWINIHLPPSVSNVCFLAKRKASKKGNWVLDLDFPLFETWLQIETAIIWQLFYFCHSWLFSTKKQGGSDPGTLHPSPIFSLIPVGLRFWVSYFLFESRDWIFGAWWQCPLPNGA